MPGELLVNTERRQDNCLQVFERYSDQGRKIAAAFKAYE